MIGTANRIALCCSLSSILLCGSPAGAQQAERPWTPRTSIERRSFSMNFTAPNHWPTTLDRPDGMLFSPDRRYFLFLEYRGDLADDSTVARVSVYSSEDVRRALRSRAARIAPLHRFEMRSRSSDKPAIGNLRWDPASTGLLFDGFDASGAPHVHFFDAASGAMTLLAGLAPASPDESDPLFDFRNGASLLFSFIVPAVPPPSYPGHWLERLPNGAPIYSADILQSIQPGPRRVARREARCDGRPAPAPDIMFSVLSLAVAPAGCRAIVLVQSDARAYEYRLLDIATGVSRLVAAAKDGRDSVSWSADGRWALLVNLQTAEGDASPPVAMLSLETGALQPVEGAGPGAQRGRMVPRWLSADTVIVPDPNSPSGASRLELRAGRWARQPGAEFPAEGRPDDGFEVRIRQGQNEPGRVVARLGNIERVLSEPDPVLARVARRDWQEISFVAPNGRTSRAALMLPAPRPGRAGPPPLIVNPYHYENYHGSHNRLFLPDGQHEGAESAAQVLAARGFAVLWMDGWDDVDLAATPAEGPGFVARLDAVLQELIRQNLVDPERIGMAGYSRGGYLSLYSATHPGRVPIRTHIAIDNYLGSAQQAFWYRSYGAPSERALDVFADRAGALERDTVLNVDRVRGPVMFTHSLGTEGHVLWTLQVMNGAFLAARRPFEQLSFPNGRHNLIRPRERLMLIEAISDWMAFWLMDETPADPERARVWAQMRSQWRRQQAWEAAGNPAGSTPPQDFQAGTASGGA